MNGDTEHGAMELIPTFSTLHETKSNTKELLLKPKPSVWVQMVNLHAQCVLNVSGMQLSVMNHMVSGEDYLTENVMR
jgi:hypothetical protein